MDEEQEQSNLTTEPTHDADAEALAMFDRWNATENTEQVEKPVESEVEKPVEQQQEKPVEKEDPKEAIEEDDLPGKGPKTEAAKATWATMKQELKELKESKLPASEKLANERAIALEEAKKRLAEFEGKDISQYEKKIAELESKYSEAEKFRAIHDVANSEAYKAEILYPAEKIGQEVDVLAKMYEADPKDLKAALQIEDASEQRKKIKELTEGWDTIDVTDLMSAARTTRQLLHRSQELLDNAEKTKGELRYIEEQESKKRAESETAAQKAAIDAVDRNIWDKIPRFKDNQEIKDAVSKAEIKKDPTSLALGAKAAAMLPHLLKHLDQRDAKIKDLEDNLAKRVSASPRPNSIAQVEKERGNGEPTDFSPEGIMARWKSVKGS
jgi:gamma-glutamylcyclotransferase (GGCT)/AIG2-like uncharacterized protein YtfP